MSSMYTSAWRRSAFFKQIRTRFRCPDHFSLLFEKLRYAFNYHCVIVCD